MKQLLLLFFFLSISALGYAQSGDCGNCIDNDLRPFGTHGTSDEFSNEKEDIVRITIYPNPATDYISLSENNVVKRIAIFNLVGREMRAYSVAKGLQYSVRDLPAGIYLIQLIDHQNNIITTQRISKR